MHSRTLHQLLGTVCHRRCSRCQILILLRDALKHFCTSKLTLTSFLYHVQLTFMGHSLGFILVFIFILVSLLTAGHFYVSGFIDWLIDWYSGLGYSGTESVPRPWPQVPRPCIIQNYNICGIYIFLTTTSITELPKHCSSAVTQSTVDASGVGSKPMRLFIILTFFSSAFFQQLLLQSLVLLHVCVSAVLLARITQMVKN